MKSTFWIQELAEKDDSGSPKLRLQYSSYGLRFFEAENQGFPDTSLPDLGVDF